ncbi:hypothetical protein NC651_009258 [Populus alba x Populus x berolinensis]|nr:hypothetical protein NC651_009258 [Populus alba x Populus x berolinensis]
MTASRRLADRKVNRFDKNISRRGAVPETTTKKGKDYPVGPLLLGFFIFVVIGSSALDNWLWLDISGGLASVIRLKNSNHQAANGRNTSHSGRSNVASSNLGAGGSSGPDSNNQGNFQWGAFSRAGGATTAAQAVNVVQRAYEKVKREREEAQAATKREEAMKRKNRAASKKMSSASSNIALENHKHGNLPLLD